MLRTTAESSVGEGLEPSELNRQALPPDAILIAGPTASGKSAVAVELAQRIGGVVINADSMQVYRDLRLLTARPSPADEAAAPHSLYGTVDGAENFSVGRYVETARAALAAARAAGQVPIITGGTGLYFKALIEGLSDIPPVPDAVREAVRARAETRPTPLLHADLSVRDPIGAAGLRPTDRQRILRAMEVHEATGRSLTSFRASRVPGPLARARMVRMFLAPERPALFARIDARFDAMLAGGALDEVAVLARRGLDPALPVMRAHGVPGLIAHLAGQCTLEAAAERARLDTRHYAKRQFTWFRHQMPGWSWVAPEAALAALLDAQAA